MINCTKCKSQKESLVLPNHMRLSGVIVDNLDDRAPRIGPSMKGAQTIKVKKRTIQMKYDGSTSSFKTELPSAIDLACLPRVYILKGRHYQFKKIKSRRGKVDFHKRLSDCFGGIPDHVVKEMLKCTTLEYSSVTVENSINPRDHYVPRFPALRPFRLTRLVYTDTFFPKVTSIRGYKCFQLFGIKHAQYIKCYLMQRKSQAITALHSFINDVGIPNEIRMDNAKEQGHSEVWKKTCLLLHIKNSFTEADHQQQDYSERAGQSIIFRAQQMLNINNAPICLWCFAIEYAELVGLLIPSRRILWIIPYQKIHGHTPDISHIRFIFYEQIEYINTEKRFPNSKWLPGRFLGIAKDTGDAFTYIVYLPPTIERTKGTVLFRSNVRSRRRPFPSRTRIRIRLNPNGLNNKMELVGPIKKKQINQLQPIPEDSKLIPTLVKRSTSEPLDDTLTVPESSSTTPSFLKEVPNIFDDPVEDNKVTKLDYPEITHEGNPTISLIDKANIKHKTIKDDDIMTLKQLYKEINKKDDKKKSKIDNLYLDKPPDDDAMPNEHIATALHTFSLTPKQREQRLK